MAAPQHAHRQAEPHATFGYTDRDGAQRELSADKDGVVRPKNPDDVAVLDAFELPAIADPEAEAKAKADRAAIEAELARDTKKPAETGAEG